MDNSIFALYANVKDIYGGAIKTRSALIMIWTIAFSYIYNEQQNCPNKTCAILQQRSEAPLYKNEVTSWIFTKPLEMFSQRNNPYCELLSISKGKVNKYFSESKAFSQ